MLETKEAEDEFLASVDERDLMTAVCKRRLFKPDDKFKEILNHVAGRYRYDDIDVMIRNLKRYLKIDEKISIKTSITKISDFVDEILKEKDNLVF